MLLSRYAAHDVGMRNLAVVALTDAGRMVSEVAAAFGLNANYVSTLRGRARDQGSAGLVRRRGRRRHAPTVLLQHDHHPLRQV